MKIVVQKSFEKDIAKINNKERAAIVFALIEELENCQTLSEISHLKKMSGKGSYYRIRVGDYRLGLKLSEQNNYSFAFYEQERYLQILSMMHQSTYQPIN